MKPTNNEPKIDADGTMTRRQYNRWNQILTHIHTLELEAEYQEAIFDGRVRCESHFDMPHQIWRMPAAGRPQVFQAILAGCTIMEAKELGDSLGAQTRETAHRVVRQAPRNPSANMTTSYLKLLLDAAKAGDDVADLRAEYNRRLGL
jgi:hypothetical protein